MLKLAATKVSFYVVLAVERVKRTEHGVGAYLHVKVKEKKSKRQLVSSVNSRIGNCN